MEREDNEDEIDPNFQNFKERELVFLHLKALAWIPAPLVEAVFSHLSIKLVEMYSSGC